jgi:ferredoxin
MTAVKADCDVCIGSGVCQSYAPDGFDVVDGKVVVKDLTGLDSSVIELAVDACPTGALSLDHE